MNNQYNSGIDWNQNPLANQTQQNYQGMMAGFNPVQSSPNLSMNWGGGTPQTPLVYQPQFYNQAGGLNQTGINALNTSGNPAPEGFLGKLGGLFGSTDEFGKFQPSGLTVGAQLGMGMFNAWGGMRQLNLAKDQFKFQKDAYNKNYQNQKQLTNTRMEDRQNARNAFSDRHEKTDSYMERNRIN